MTTAAPTRFDYLLVGGGLATSLIALALFETQPTARVGLVERQARLGGNHLWCFHAGDVDKARSFVNPLVVRRWTRYQVRFPQLERVLDEPYAAVTSNRLDEVVQSAFAKRVESGSRLFLSQSTARSSATQVLLASGQELQADVVIESRGPAALPTTSRTGYQKFVGLELELSAPSPLVVPMLMDALVPQLGGFRFMYGLPLAYDRVLLEDTYFADSPELDHPHLEAEILAYADKNGFKVRRIVRRESGVLPLPTSVLAQNEPGPDRALVAGYQGGWFHPVTGYSFPVAVRVAHAVASSDPATLRARVWPTLRRQQHSQLRFGALLNRLLFGAFAPEQRHSVIERFYRLPPETVRRFYALNLTRSDQLRIVCGRPPRGFSLSRALGFDTAPGAAIS